MPSLSDFSWWKLIIWSCVLGFCFFVARKCIDVETSPKFRSRQFMMDCLKKQTHETCEKNLEVYMKQFSR